MGVKSYSYLSESDFCATVCFNFEYVHKIRHVKASFNTYSIWKNYGFLN